MDLEIDLRDLRRTIDRIFDHLERDLQIRSVKLAEDNYWDSPEAERYDFSKSPREWHSGQLYDDWHFLSKILEDDERAVAYMLVHAAPLLRYIGESIKK